MGRAVNWRVIYSGHSDGYHNMAVDEAIMESIGAELAPPTLRIYGWSPPAVSLGRFQEVAEQVDVEVIQQHGWDLVRRPTGGRAVLHDDEVTYSVCVPQDQLEGGDSVLRSYRYLARGIQRGLELLGVEAELGRTPPAVGGKGGRHQQSAICFSHPTRADMVAAGHKIVGSAQVRKNGVILQHGSVPITLDIANHLAVMAGGRYSNKPELLQQAAVGVSQVLCRDVSYDELAEALVAGFSQALGVELQVGELSRWEQARAEDLFVHKYGTDAWNLTVPDHHTTISTGRQ